MVAGRALALLAAALLAVAALPPERAAAQGTLPDSPEARALRQEVRQQLLDLGGQLADARRVLDAMPQDDPRRPEQLRLIAGLEAGIQLQAQRAASLLPREEFLALVRQAGVEAVLLAPLPAIQRDREAAQRLPDSLDLRQVQISPLGPDAAGRGLPPDSTLAFQLLPYIDAGGVAAPERNRGEFGAWIPLVTHPQPGSVIPFLDFRGRWNEDSDFSGGAAFGVRAPLPSGWNMGAYGGLDWYQSGAGNDFWGAMFGLEALHPENVDLRFNVSTPLGDDKKPVSRAQTQTMTALEGGGPPSFHFDGNRLSMVSGGVFDVNTTDRSVDDFAPWSVNAEAGLRLPLESVFPVDPNRVEWRVYGGVSFFDHPDLADPVTAWGLRTALTVNDAFGFAGSRLRLEGRWQRRESDDVLLDAQLERDLFELGVFLSLPFGGGKGKGLLGPAGLAALDPQTRRLSEPIHRFGGPPVFTVARETRTTETFDTVVKEPVVDPATGVVLDSVGFATDGNLQDTIADNDLIIVNGDNAGGVNTRDNKTILGGGGTTIPFEGAKTGQVADFTAPGPAGTVFEPGNVPVITTGSNVHIAGLNVIGGGGGGGNPVGFNDGILVRENTTNVVIEQSRITNTGDNGIRLAPGSGNVRLPDNQIDNAGGNGLFLQDNNFNVNIVNNQIDNAGGSGLFALNPTGLFIEGMSVNGAGGAGFELDGLGDGNTATIADSIFQNNGGPGVNLTNNNGTIEIQNTLIAGNQGGVFVAGGGGGISFDDTSIANNSAFPALSVTDFSGDLNFIGGGIDHQTGAAPAVKVTDTNGANLDFNALVTANNTGNANGIEFFNNPDSTVNFTGGLDITTQDGTAWFVLNSGTVGVSNSEVTNNLRTTGNAVNAFNMQDTDIAAGGLNFTSIISDTPTVEHGIDINNVAGGPLNVGNLAILDTGGTFNGVNIIDSPIDTTFNQVDIGNAGEFGVFIDNSKQFRINGGTIQNAEAGIVSGNAGVDLNNVQITDTQFGLILDQGPLGLNNVAIDSTDVNAVLGERVDATIADSRFTNADFGMTVFNDNNLLIDGLTLENREVGLLFGINNSATAFGLNILNPGDVGLVLAGDNNTVNLEGGSIVNPGQAGLLIGGGNIFTATDTAVQGAAAPPVTEIDAVRITAFGPPVPSTVTLTNLAFTGDFTHVIHIDTPNNNLAGTGNIFTGAGILCFNLGGPQNGAIGFATPLATCP